MKEKRGKDWKNEYSVEALATIQQDHYKVSSETRKPDHRKGPQKRSAGMNPKRQRKAHRTVPKSKEWDNTVGLYEDCWR